MYETSFSGAIKKSHPVSQLRGIEGLREIKAKESTMRGRELYRCYHQLINAIAQSAEPGVDWWAELRACIERFEADAGDHPPSVLSGSARSFVHSLSTRRFKALGSSGARSCLPR